MIYCECPQPLSCNGQRSLFLGGGISNCPDWQSEMVARLRLTDLALLNPRRANFRMGDTEQQRIQIGWEYYHLQLADAHLFWFCKETLCPISLFELGKWCAKDRPLFVGCDPDYARRSDIEIQMGLQRPLDCRISTSLNDLSLRVIHWSRENKQ